MKQKYKKGVSKLILVAIIAFLLVGGIYIAKNNTNSSDIENQKQIEKLIDSEIENSKKDLNLIDSSDNKEENTTTDTEKELLELNQTGAEPGALLPTDAAGEAMPGSPDFEVSYTNNGYSPKDFNIPVGTTVIFINESAQAMWTASDMHPSHTLLPDFDQLGTGQVYSYTFTKAGVWSYHNHRAPNHGGEITVE
jgi:plastocyanin